jgi:hypothetical protein
VNAPPPESSRRFTAPDGATWEARLIDAGRPSPYLAARLAHPIIQFTRLDAGAAPRTYAPYLGHSLGTLGDADLLALWRQSRSY